MTDEARALAEANLRLAYWIANPYALRLPRLADRIQSAAMRALCRAARRFDPTRGVRFSTYANKVIRREIAGVISSRDDHLKVVGLVPDAEEYGRVVGREPDPEIGHAIASAEAFEAMLGKLPPRLADICRRIYGDGQTCTQVAESLMISKQRVRFLRDKALALLKERLTHACA